MNLDFDSSMKQFENAIRIRRKIFGDLHLKVAETLYNIALLHASKGNLSRSLKCLQKMISILRNENNGFSDDYFHIHNALKWISFLEEKIASCQGSKSSFVDNQFEEEVTF